MTVNYHCSRIRHDKLIWPTDTREDGQCVSSSPFCCKNKLKRPEYKSYHLPPVISVCAVEICRWSSRVHFLHVKLLEMILGGAQLSIMTL